MKIKSWPKLIISIILAQSAGLIGTFFTFDAIPTWYATLTKPVFSPPNWIFGPVWTILYTLIGISLYLIWTSKKGSLKLFFFHLFLNAIWSPVFFGLKNLSLAFLIIIAMDITLVMIIKNFYKVNKLASYLLVPYLVWILFASLLNYSIWQLNKSDLDVYAQEFTFEKARQDYVYVGDVYRKDLNDFNLKRASYAKNSTLSLKEELRLSTYNFIGSRNNFIKSYLTMLRLKTLESQGLETSKKQEIYSNLDPEVVWYETRKDSYNPADNLEDLFSKSKDEDTRYLGKTLPIIYNGLANISLGDVTNIKNKHVEMYNKLKSEANSLVSLGRADSSLFDRWFRDIDGEITNINAIENNTKIEIEKILSADDYQRDSGYKRAMEKLSLVKTNLNKLNNYLGELENVIISKR